MGTTVEVAATVFNGGQARIVSRSASPPDVATWGGGRQCKGVGARWEWGRDGGGRQCCGLRRLHVPPGALPVLSSQVAPAFAGVAAAAVAQRRLWRGQRSEAVMAAAFPRPLSAGKDDFAWGRPRSPPLPWPLRWTPSSCRLWGRGADGVAADATGVPADDGVDGVSAVPVVGAASASFSSTTAATVVVDDSGDGCRRR